MEFENLIGATPIYRAGENLYLKTEYTNVTGSVKDRTTLELILDAERRGVLRAGGTVIEPTSGNTGVSLAAIAAQRGYGCILVMPRHMSTERRRLMRAYGAQIVLTEGGMRDAVAQAKSLVARTPGAYMPNQFENPANPMAHYRTTGPEIWAALHEVDFLVAGVGTGGTISGVGRFLKERNAALCVVAVEPAESPLLSGGTAGRHGIEGIGADFIPKVLDVTLLDRVETVTQAQAVAGARALARQGILVGVSSGAAYHAAKKIAAENPGRKVVAILPDSGDRYLSTALFYDETD